MFGKSSTNTGEPAQLYRYRTQALVGPWRKTARQAVLDALHANIQRLKLDVQVIAPFHGNRKSDVAELARLAGVNATN